VAGDLLMQFTDPDAARLDNSGTVTVIGTCTDEGATVTGTNPCG
jgi:hypothetical protein